MADTRTEVVLVRLQNGSMIHVEARALGGRETVGVLPAQPIEDLMSSIEGIAAALSDTLRSIRPQKAAVEFGIEVGIESGKLTALLCKAEGKANLKITLEWSGLPT